MRRKRIESSPEIEALLHAFLKKLKADTAILYKFIDEEDLEGTEILDLLSKSQMVKRNPLFYKEVINDKTFEEVEGLKKLVGRYEYGELDLEDDKVINVLYKLKKYIKVLRFCDLSEKDPKESRWNFDYTRRPPKYLVLSDEILNEKYQKKQIKYEGYTAYFCRKSKNSSSYIDYQRSGINPKTSKKESKGEIIQFKLIPFELLSREEINGSPSHSDFGKDQTVFSNYDSHHAGWILLEKNNIESDTKNKKNNDSQMIGCLRFEYYLPIKPDQRDTAVFITSESKKNFVGEYENVSISPVMDLVVTEILNVMAKQKEQSYSEQYHCLEPILKQLKKIGIQIKKHRVKFTNSTNGKIPKRNTCEIEKDLETLYNIHYQIEHLFYVLKRNTYYGEAILERITCFIEDILKTMGLPENIFINIWENLRRHEDLMLYSLEEYRDHLMHQFHVFITGYMIIYSYGIGCLRNQLEEQYKDFLMKGEDIHNKEMNIKKTFFSMTDVLRIWVMASLFHDCGYAFEKLSQGFEEFSNRVLGVSLKSHFFWDETLLDTANIPIMLQGISEYFKTYPAPNNPTYSVFDKVDLFRILVQKAILNNDHGVISAIILMQQYLNHYKGYMDVPRIESIMNIASIAIALHNRSVFEEVKKQGNESISIKYNPIAFILVYCDTTQEWGRKKTVPVEKRIATPHLNSLKFPKIKLEDENVKNSQKKNHFSIELNYPARSPGRAPDTSKLKEMLAPTLSAFSTPYGYSFEIHFNIRSSSSVSFKRIFSVRDND
jgi:hypothetical protein